MNRRLILAGVGALAYLTIPPLLFAGSPYILSVLTNAAILSVIASGVWLTFAIGRINISQGAFALIGGYATAILSTRYGLSFWICLPLSGLIAALIGVLVGAPILRLKGVYFSMISLSLTEAVRLAALNAQALTQGATGIVNIPRPGALRLAGVTLIEGFDGSSPLPYFYLSAVLLLLTLWALWRIAQSRIGQVFHSLRLNEELAASLGVNVAAYRVIAFGMCCFIGGIGGAFFAAFHQNIYPASYTVTDSMNFMIYGFLGGLDYIFGPLVGAYLLTLAFESLHGIQRFQSIIYACLMIIVMLVLPNGLLSARRQRGG